MAKKKHQKQHKKHQFKHAPSRAAAGSTAETKPSASATAGGASATLAKPAAAANPAGMLSVDSELGFVRRDLRKVGFLAGGFVLLELGLWLLFNHTAVGPQVYRLIHF